MSVLYRCRGCQAQLSVSESMAGKWMKCPNCEFFSTVPAFAVVSDQKPEQVNDATVSAVQSPKGKGRDKGPNPKPLIVKTTEIDANLLFGVLALQAAFIDNDKFAEICSAWATRKRTPLADLLVERGMLTPDDRKEVDRSFQRHMSRHAGNPSASLAAIAGGIAISTLDQLSDEGIRKSLTTLTQMISIQKSTITHIGVGSDVGTGNTTIDCSPIGRDRYSVIRTHAKGGIGQVLLVRDERLGREVALKELLPKRANDLSSLNRFGFEARITGQLEHPGIVPVYELVGRADGHPHFYTMRFIRGRTLAEAVQVYHDAARGEAKRLDQVTLLRAFVSVCNTVAYAHSRGVVHRDLKSLNIVLGDFGEVILLDWGLAKLLKQPEGVDESPPISLPLALRPDETSDGSVLGTPAYMAPEQAKGRVDKVNGTTDTYSLGAMLYEIVTGVPPFTGTDTREVLRKVIEDIPRKPTEVNRAVPLPLQSICLKALSKKQNQRYQSATDLSDDVLRWLSDEPVLAHRDSPPRKMARLVRRHPTPATAVLLLAVVLSAGGMWLKLAADRRSATAAQEEARIEGQVLAAADEAQLRLVELNIDGAKAALDRAQERLAIVSQDLQQRVRQLRVDVATSEKLDRVLLLETFTAGKFENAAASSAYEEAFRGYGIDPTASNSAKTVELIRQSAIREQLITALDDWVFVYPRADYTGRERVLGLVKAADADNWRQQLRDPDTHKDKTKLEELSKDRRAATQSPSILVHLGKYLAQAGSWAASVDLLERAQRAYPADYWVNFGLATALYEGKSADTARAVEYFRAALAVRPLSRTAHLVLGRLLLIQRQSADAVTHL